MKIQTTVTVYDKVEMDIELPYYCQFEDKFFKVVSDKKTIQVIARESYSVISSSETWLYEKDIAKSTAITAIQFTDAWLTALNNISSSPKAVAA